MSKDQNSGVVEALGVDPANMQDFCASLVHNAFFNKLASFGIVPQTEEEAVKYWEASERLEAQTAKVARAQSQNRIDNVLNLLGGGTKQAAAPQVEPTELEVWEKTAGLLAVPSVFAHAVGLRTLQAAARQAS